MLEKYKSKQWQRNRRFSRDQRCGEPNSMTRRRHLQILGPVDTAFYYVDRPETPMNIGALSIFEGQIPFNDLVTMVEARIYRAPLYQQRVIQAPLTLGQPSWAFDPDFYVGNHVFEIELPTPGDDEQLRELAGHLVSSRLDRAKPLWEIYLISGLAGDRTAMLFKVHHCMVDGLAAVELFTLLMDMTKEPQPSKRPPQYDLPPLPSPTELITSAIKADLPHRWGVLKKLGGDIFQLGAVLTDKEQRRQTLFGIANLINDNLSPIKKLPLNGENTGRLTLGYAEFSLEEIHAIRADQHASVNEVMLSILGGGVDLYLRDHPDRGEQEFLRALVPVNMREESEKNDYGNRISVLPIDLPFTASSPLERLRKIVEYSQIMKHSSLTIGLDMVLMLPSLYPSFTQPLIWEIAPRAFSLMAHTWCTNVAGPPIPVYVLGHQMLHSYGYFPLNPSMGLACVILSYNGKITMTLIADAGIIPDVLRLRDCLQEAYVALRQAAQVEPIPADPPPATKIPADPPDDEIILAVELIESPDTAPAQVAEPDAASAYANGTSVPTANDKPQLFSEEWALAYHEAINGSASYRRVSLRWEAGSLAFVIHASPRNGFPRPAAVLLDLYRGECRSAHSLPVNEAVRQASFVIEGEYGNWMKVLNGESDPLKMLMRGSLRLSKGSLLRLIPFTQSAHELVHSAQHIS